jgi:glycosyltransferase involved in cell wall biosynthesis
VLTVLLATRNRGVILGSVLESLCQVRAPMSGWKLLVVDNGSTDQTGRVISSFTSRLPLEFLREPRLGKNCALNAGLAHAEGDLIVFMDDDVFACEDWLVRLRRAADCRAECSMFGGSVVPRWEVCPPAWMAWADQGAAYAITNPTWKEGPITADCIWGLNMAIRSDVFQSGIRFDTAMGPRGSNYRQGGDTELTRRLEAQGHKAWHVPGAVVEHLIRKDQIERAWLMRRAFRHGRGEYRIEHAKHIKSGRLMLGAARRLFPELFSHAFEMTKARVSRKQPELFRSHWRFNYIRGQLWEWLLNILLSCQEPQMGEMGTESAGQANS